MTRSGSRQSSFPWLAKRRAMMLNELVIMLAVMVLLMLIAAGLFHALLHELPHSLKDFNEYTSLRHLLRQIEKDMHSGVQLPATVGDSIAGPSLLLIQTDTDLVCYEQKDDTIVRSILTGQETTDPSQGTWSIPHGVIRWNPRTIKNQTCAVEIQSHLFRKINGRWEKRFTNSHLFFLGSDLQGGQR